MESVQSMRNALIDLREKKDKLRKAEHEASLDPKVENIPFLTKAREEYTTAFSKYADMMDGTRVEELLEELFKAQEENELLNSVIESPEFYVSYISEDLGNHWADIIKFHQDKWRKLESYLNGLKDYYKKQSEPYSLDAIMFVIRMMNAISRGDAVPESLKIKGELDQKTKS